MMSGANTDCGQDKGAQTAQLRAQPTTHSHHIQTHAPTCLPACLPATVERLVQCLNRQDAGAAATSHTVIGAGTSCRSRPL